MITAPREEDSQDEVRRLITEEEQAIEYYSKKVRLYQGWLDHHQGRLDVLLTAIPAPIRLPEPGHSGS